MRAPGNRRLLVLLVAAMFASAAADRGLLQKRQVLPAPGPERAVPGSSTQNQTAPSDGNPGEAATDTRSLVPDTSAYPFSSVGIIRLQDYTGVGLCTGALIASRFVLTAAHWWVAQHVYMTNTGCCSWPF